MQIPILSILFMAVSAIISIGLPVALFIIVRKKYHASFIPMLIGAAAFVIFVLLLESSIHKYVFAHFALTEKPALYVLYGIFMAGIFEETARFISFTFLKKKFDGIGTGLSYGIGHGGIEAVLLAGISMINAIVLSVMYNAGTINTIIENLQGAQLQQTVASINTIAATAPSMFLVSGIERIFAVSVQISLSMLVFYSVYSKGKIWLFPCAVLLHAITDIPAASFQIGALKSLLLVEGLTGICAATLVFLAYKAHALFGKSGPKPAVSE